MRCLYLFLLCLISGAGSPTTANGQSTEEDLEDLFAEFDDEADTASPLLLKGFVDGRFGPRLITPQENDSYSLAELRGQFDLRYVDDQLQGILVTDLKYSPLHPLGFEDIETGVGLIDLRECSVGWTPGTTFSIKAGRQILTWGTGDLLFINDLFPKDWQALLTGRPINYLKAPSNSFKISHFNKWLTIDLVYTPLFASDRFINGSVVEYFDPFTSGITGASTTVNPIKRRSWLRDGEWALRLHKIVKGVEYDVYGYRGFWKTPEGFTREARFFFPRLSVLGASLRTPLLSGIFNAEYGHYFSGEQKADRGAIIRNSEDRWLIGFEKEVAKNFTLGGQFYVEYINDFDNYLVDFGHLALRKEWRTLFSLRLEYLALGQNLRLSCFHFYSPSDRDVYLKYSLYYKPDDDLQFEMGTNIFSGKNRFSFFGQLETNTNLYFAVTRFFK